MDRICEVLASSDGKDKILRLLSYSSLLIGSASFCPSPLKNALKIFSGQLSSARTVTRLVDDLPMLQYSFHCLNNHFGKTEDFLQMLINLVDQLYYPVEHLEWASGVGMTRKSSWFVPGTATIHLWTASLVLNQALALKRLASCKSTQSMQKEFINFVRVSCDLINAINWMPSNSFLWAGTLSDFVAGLLGTVSSVLFIVQMSQNKHA